ncbi:MAG: hypothetical protein LBJ00_03505 [Planctomycetaceae bacterium]|nr:hypothetical protein [Planctomycetaceae bacterium]
MTVQKLFKKLIGLFAEKCESDKKTNKHTSRRRLGFEVLEGHELLSANWSGNNFDDTDTHWQNNQNNWDSNYYESGILSANSGTIEELEMFAAALGKGCDCESCEQADNWTVNLTGQTNSDGSIPIYSESTQDSFDVTITRTNNVSNTADKNYAINFDLTFSGEATKDDFEIYNGNTKISNNTSSCKNSNSVFSYSIPANEISITLTFKLVDIPKLF